MNSLDKPSVVGEEGSKASGKVERSIRVWILPLLFLLGGGFIAYGGTDTYVVPVRSFADYPLAGVLEVILLLAVEFLILFGVIRPLTYKNHIIRSGLACFISLFFAFMFLAHALQAPPYYDNRFAFAFFLMLLCWLVFLWALFYRGLRAAFSQS